MSSRRPHHIKCRKAGLTPAAVVIVATVRALKLHGGADAKNLGPEDLGALEKGIRGSEEPMSGFEPLTY